MLQPGIERDEREDAVTGDMVWSPGETFRIRSNRHYLAEAPATCSKVACICARYCRRYRLAARHAESVDTSPGHVGFRCVVRSSIFLHST